MHLDPWATMEGRHLILAYAAVILIHAGYLAWIGAQFLKLKAQKEKATKPFWPGAS